MTQNKIEELIKNLIKEARKYKDTPVYYYSEFDLHRFGLLIDD